MTSDIKLSPSNEPIEINQIDVNFDYSRNVVCSNFLKLACSICFEELDVDSFDYKCSNFYDGSHFCFVCLKVYLSSKISSSDFNFDGSIPCPCGLCGSHFGEIEISHYVEEELVERYYSYLESKRVDENPLSRWCPNPLCAKVVYLKKIGQKIIKCPFCNLKFCAKCNESHNSLISCGMVSILNHFVIVFELIINF